jgi:hypothetical protein
MASQESELPIPMPEIPGYTPPVQQYSQYPYGSYYASPQSIPYTPAQWTAMYGGTLSNRGHPAQQSQQSSWHRSSFHNRYSSVQSSSPITPQSYGSAIYSNTYQSNPPSSPTWRNYTNSTNRDVTHLPPLIPPSSTQNTLYLNASYSVGYSGRSGMDADWLQPHVPSGIFGLIGETLLCPFKVTIYILREMFWRGK